MTEHNARIVIRERDDGTEVCAVACDAKGHLLYDVVIKVIGFPTDAETPADDALTSSPGGEASGADAENRKEADATGNGGEAPYPPLGV